MSFGPTAASGYALPGESATAGEIAKQTGAEGR